MNFSELDHQLMFRALQLAEQAAAKAEVPVGAVIANEQGVVAEAFNLRETQKNPLAHAEILAIEAAAAKLDRWRLSDCTIYVSLEPCAMCAGALVNARVRKVIFAASDPKTGCVGSLMNLCQDQRLNHRVEVTSGLLAERSAELLKNFFQARRQRA